jgi:hypothetical protein
LQHFPRERRGRSSQFALGGGGRRTRQIAQVRNNSHTPDQFPPQVRETILR